MLRFKTLNPRNSLRTRLVYIVGSIGLIMTLFSTYLVGMRSIEQVKHDKGTLMQELAAQMSREMDKGIFDRRREIQIVASLKLLSDSSISIEEKRTFLETLQASYQNYAWIGFTDAEGTILAGTQSLLEGKNVKARNWFINGSRAPSVGDVHDAFLLARVLPKPKHDFLPLRLLDVSAPIKDENGRLLGVLCGHLSWDWAFEVRNSLLEPLKEVSDVDVLIFNRSSGLLLGTPQLSQIAPNSELPSLMAANTSQQGYIEELWPDGQHYLTGYFHSQGFEDYPGLGWSVLVRQKARLAYAPAYALQEHTFMLMALFSAIFLTLLWLISGRLVHPLRLIAVNADKIHRGTLAAHEIPVFRGRDEVAVMSHSLANLVNTLAEKNQELKLAAQVFNSSTEGIVITDAEDKILTINQAYSDITGYSVAEVLGRKPSILSSGKHPPEFYREMWNEIRQTGHWAGEVLNRRKNGEFFPEWLTITTVYDDTGKVTHYVGIFNDITQRKAAEEKIRFLAHHDSLTALPNRLVFEDRLAEAIRQAKATHSIVAVLFADLNRFKNINDSLGHPIGDLVLQQIAERFNQCIGKKDTVARFGGDEFIIIMPDIQHAQEAGVMAQRIVDQVQPTLHVDDYQLHVTVSIGISLYPHDGDNATTLVKHADAAMYHAKEFESHAYRFFTSDLNQRVSERLRLENALHQALPNQELFIVYQPQFNLQTQKVTGAEVLLRWQHSELGLISPATFIPIAEETGLVVPIGEWVIRTVCNDYRKLCEFYRDKLCLAINLSPVQIESSDIPTILKEAIEKNMLSSCDWLELEVEITESAIVRSLDVARDMLHRLHAMKIKIAIDDFGTGYSNLNILKQLDIDRLKIDQSFIRQLPNNESDISLVRAIIAMARSLDLDVIGEGVETQEQLQCLRSLDCSSGQGFLLGRPMRIEEFETFLRETQSERITATELN